MTNPPFWQTKSLEQMSSAEWELLCDGCGYCCLIKLEDEDTGKLYTTNVACRLLDTKTCRCRDYANRTAQVPQCMVIAATEPKLFEQLPASCAYRRLHYGQPLEQWHPLLSGDQKSVRESGASICDYAISEEYVHPEQLEDHIIHALEDVQD